MQLEFIHQDDRILDAPSNEIVNDREERLFPGRHLRQVEYPPISLQEEIGTIDPRRGCALHLGGADEIQIWPVRANRD